MRQSNGFCRGASIGGPGVAFDESELFKPSDKLAPESESISAMRSDNDRDLVEIFCQDSDQTLRKNPVGMDHVRLFRSNQPPQRKSHRYEKEGHLKPEPGVTLQVSDYSRAVRQSA